MAVPKTIIIAPLSRRTTLAVGNYSTRNGLSLLSAKPKIQHMDSSSSNESFSSMDYRISSTECVTDTAKPPRKRQRLDHLTIEEKIMRRKVKNRVAAQSARDRKKAQMSELECVVKELSYEKDKVLIENEELRERNLQLEQENVELKRRLGLIQEEQSKKNVVVVKKETDDCNSVKHAEGPGSTVSYSLDDAISLLSSDTESDDLLKLLQECGEELLQCNLDIPNPDEPSQKGVCGFDTNAEVVGSTSEDLESIKELIHFDHVYYKEPVSKVRSQSVSPRDLKITVTPPSVTTVQDSLQTPTVDTMTSNLVPDSNSTNTLLNVQSPMEFYTSSSESDAGYDSAKSPLSDRSMTPPSLMDDSEWDDSFSELFPTLI